MIKRYRGTMVRAISVRLDHAADAALAQLTADGRDQSQAVREALIESATRRHRAQLVEEAAELAADEADRAESAHVAALMESLRATP
jgi:Arc/MetJ-type ribon-helix-helix transcriptional regulator